MKLKQILALLIALAMITCMFAACGGGNQETKPSESTPANDNTENTDNTEDTGSDKPAPSTDPLTMIYEGYYTYTYPIEGMDDMCAFFHFYPEAPVLGSVFYASFAWNQITFAGTYTVEKADFEYSVYPSREEQIKEDPQKVTGTAPYTITFYDFDGNELDSCGYDGEKLYNDMTKVTGTGGADSIYTHELAGEESKHWGTLSGEIGISYLSFVSTEDTTCTVTLQHNSTYTDLVGMMVQGNWVMSENEDGTYNFKLTPTESYDVGATLVVAADKMSATYTADDGSITMELVNTAVTGPKLVHQLKGLFNLGEGLGDADVILSLYDDGNCNLIMTAFGSEMPLDEGTYTIGADGYTITCAFKAAGELSTYLSDAGVSMQYVQAGSAMGDLDITLNYAPIESDEPTVSFTFEGIHNLGDAGDATLTLTLMSDNTCKLVASAYGQSMDVDAGTYAMQSNGYTIDFNFDGAGAITSYLDGATVSVQYVNAESPLGPIDSVLAIVM